MYHNHVPCTMQPCSHTMQPCTMQPYHAAIPCNHVLCNHVLCNHTMQPCTTGTHATFCLRDFGAACFATVAEHYGMASRTLEDRTPQHCIKAVRLPWYWQMLTPRFCIAPFSHIIEAAFIMDDEKVWDSPGIDRCSSRCAASFHPQT